MLGVPCITFRTSTERPITVELGTNRLVGIDAGALAAACARELERQPPERCRTRTATTSSSPTTCSATS